MMFYALFFLLCGLIGCTPIAYAAYHSWQIEQLRHCAEQVYQRPMRPEGSTTLPGVTMREAATALATMGNAGPWVRDLLPEQCSYTQTNEDGYELVLPVEEMH